MPPAKQRLDSGHDPIAQRELRLIVENKLFAFKGAMQTSLSLETCTGLGARSLVEHDIAGSTELLGPIHGGVGLGQQRFVCLTESGEREPDAAGQVDLVAL